ncbi:MAG: replicative DNA helicase [Candidatus Nanopelagicaceae bacterium]
MIDNKQLNAEASILGGAMVDIHGYLEARATLSSNDFTDPLHRRIWDAIGELVDSGKSTLATDVFSYLQSKGEVDQERFFHVASHMPIGTSGLKDQLKTSGTRRQIEAAIHQVAGWFTEGDVENDELIAKAQETFLSLGASSHQNRNGLELISGPVEEAIDDIERIQKSGETTGLKSGISSLDKSIGGFKPGALYILAARPAMGKTALALNIASAVSLRDHVAFFSLEMPKKQIGQRLLSSYSGVSVQRIDEATVKTDEIPHLVSAAESIKDNKLWVDDSAGSSVSYIKGQLRLLQSKQIQIGMVVIDYLQLMGGSKKGARRSREQEVSEISRSLKELAKDFDCPVICLSQLNRGVESRPNKRPLLSDLRESGSIEQDADMVLFVYRDEYYHQESEDKGLAEVIIAKNRSGRTGTTKLSFSGETVRFYAVEYYADATWS